MQTSPRGAIAHNVLLPRNFQIQIQVLAVDEPPCPNFIGMYIIVFGSATALRADASRWFLD